MDITSQGISFRLSCDQGQFSVCIKEVLINWLRARIAALRGTRNLAVYRILSRFLRSMRLALHHARSINQRFLKRIRSL
jgi:hypothetical protein